MSRRALWPAATPADGALPHCRAPSPNGDPGNEPPEIPTGAEIPAHGATGRDAAAVLERIAALHDALGNEHRALSRILHNQLAVPPERALMCNVEKPLLTTEDVAARLRVDVRTVRRWRKAGKIPAGIEVGGVIRWRADDFEEWARR